MESLFFGPSSSSLYGVYSSPRPGRDRQEGVVFCYPYGQEYMRAHRVMRQLAINLADLGYHVLRFDYRGTGDSTGDMSAATFDQWVADTQLAVDELRDMTAVQKFALIGLRLGGMVAAEAACQRRDISRLVLWDPVCSGSEHIGELQGSLPKLPIDAGLSDFIDEQDSIHLNGFSFPKPFQESLAERELAPLDISPLNSVLQLVSHENPQFTMLQNAWAEQACYKYLLEPAPHDWNYVDNFGSILLPQPIMSAIRSWFE